MMTSPVACQKRIRRRSRRGSIREVSSLSYGMDSEDEALRRNIFRNSSDPRPENSPKYFWRMLLIDAWVLRNVRHFFQKAIIWSFLFMFLGMTTAYFFLSVSIIGPSNQCKLSQQEILQLGVEERAILNLSDITEEMEKLREVSAQNVSSCSEKVFFSEKDSKLERLSEKLKHTKEKKMMIQKSLLVLPSIIKFRKRNNIPRRELSASPANHKNNINMEMESIYKRKFTEAAWDMTSKLKDLEYLIQQIRVEIGRLQMDLTEKERSQEDSKIRKIVHEEIIEVEKEKLGLPDFALESSGGSIIGTPETKTYAIRTVVQVFGFPLWYMETSPRMAIQASVNPGECWSFHGSAGNLRIQLAAPAILYGFSMYHIPQKISLSGDITSSPREFSVVGIINSEEENTEILMGEYEYQNNGPPLQTFLIQREVSTPFVIVELRIKSNYGHPEFTCLYRFQVHGRFSVG